MKRANKESTKKKNDDETETLKIIEEVKIRIAETTCPQQRKSLQDALKLTEKWLAAMNGDEDALISLGRQILD